VLLPLKTVLPQLPCSHPGHADQSLAGNGISLRARVGETLPRRRLMCSLWSAQACKVATIASWMAASADSWSSCCHRIPERLERTVCRCNLSTVHLYLRLRLGPQLLDTLLMLGHPCLQVRVLHPSHGMRHRQQRVDSKSAKRTHHCAGVEHLALQPLHFLRLHVGWHQPRRYVQGIGYHV
jgi:hypothetical protein